MRARTTSHTLTAVAAVGLFVVLLAACGKDSKTASSSAAADRYGSTSTAGGATATTSADDAASTVVAKEFSLTSVTVKAGADVYFSNQGTINHTMTSDNGTSFNTNVVAAGKQAEFKAPTTPGVYAFHCAIHPTTMKGTLTVQ